MIKSLKVAQWLITTGFPTCDFYERSPLESDHYLMLSHVSSSNQPGNTTLRAFQDSHIGAFLGYRCDPKVAKFQSWDAPYPKVEAIAFIKLMKQLIPGVLGEWYQLAIVL